MSTMTQPVSSSKKRAKAKTRPEDSLLPALLLGVALLLAAVSYWPALQYGFVFDDTPQVVHNPALTSWRYLSQYFTANVWASVFPGNGNYYRPLFLLWLRLNYVLFGVTPWGWHLTSLLAHLATVWVFFFVVEQWTGDGVVAGWAAMLFAVHPIHIEAVAWVSGVPDVLFALAGLGAIYFYFRFRRDKRWTTLAVAATLYAAALLTKETAIAIWPVIAIGDWWAQRNPEAGEARAGWLGWAKRQIPFALATVAYVDLRLYALRGVAGGTVTHTFSEVLRAAPYLLIFYLRKLVWPSGLSVVYFGQEPGSFASPLFLWPMVALCAAAVGLLMWVRKSRLVMHPATLAIFAIIPPIVGVSVFLRHDLAHDRHLYLPSAGFCILAALALRAATIGERRWAGLRSQWLGHGVVAALALCLVVSLRAQEWPFRDNIALFAHAAKVSPESAQAWGYLGEELMAREHTEEGTAAFRRAQLLEPDGLLNNYRLAAAYYQAEEMALAEFYFQRAVERYRPPEPVSYDYALYRLGLSQYAQDKMAAAEASFRRATERHPNAPGYHVALASALKHEGKLEEARLQSELELQIAPDTETTELLRDVNAQMESRPADSVKSQAAPSRTK